MHEYIHSMMWKGKGGGGEGEGCRIDQPTSY